MKEYAHTVVIDINHTGAASRTALIRAEIYTTYGQLVSVHSKVYPVTHPRRPWASIDEVCHYMRLSDADTSTYRNLQTQRTFAWPEAVSTTRGRE